ncbi:hypothetical protein D3C84_326400 [compost metagenome]
MRRHPLEGRPGVPAVPLPQRLALDELARRAGQAVVAVDGVVVEAEVVEQVLAAQDEPAESPGAAQLHALVDGALGVDRAQRIAVGVVERQQFVADLAAVDRQVQVEIAACPAQAGLQGIGALLVVAGHHLAAGQLAEGRRLEALAEVGEQLHVRAQVVTQADAADAPDVGGIERLVATAHQAVVDLALLVQPGGPADQRPALGQRHLQLGEGVQIARGLVQFVDPASLVAADVEVARVPVAPVAGLDAAGPAPAVAARPLVAQAQAVVLAVDIQHLEDRVEQRLLAVVAGQFQAMAVAQLQGADIADPVEGEVAPLVASEAARRSLLRVAAHLRLGQAAGQLRVGFHMGQVEAGSQVLVDLPAEVGEVALVVLAGVVAEAVLGIVVDAQVGVPGAEVLGHRAEQPLVVEAASLHAQVDRRGRLPGRRDEVDRPAEVGRAVAPGVGAAQHLDVVGGQRFDGLEVEAAVGQVDRRAVLHQQQAAAVEGALQAGAADRQARLLGAEARLDEHPGGQAQGVLQGAAAPALVGFGVDNAGAAGYLRELDALFRQRGRGWVARLALTYDDGLQLDLFGLGRGGQRDGNGEQTHDGKVAHDDLLILFFIPWACMTLFPASGRRIGRTPALPNRDKAVEAGQRLFRGTAEGAATRRGSAQGWSAREAAASARGDQGPRGLAGGQVWRGGVRSCWLAGRNQRRCCGRSHSRRANSAGSATRMKEAQQPQPNTLSESPGARSLKPLSSAGAGCPCSEQKVPPMPLSCRPAICP